jgi:hypothetical protein
MHIDRVVGTVCSELTSSCKQLTFLAMKTSDAQIPALSEAPTHLDYLESIRILMLESIRVPFGRLWAHWPALKT